MISTPKPLRFRFTLRTLFVVVTLIACWLGYQLNWIQQRHAFLEANKQRDTPVVAAPWSIRFFGERGYLVVYVETKDQKVISDETLDPETIRRLDEARRLFPEAAIDFTFYQRHRPTH